MQEQYNNKKVIESKIVRWLLQLKRQSMCIYFCFVINVNKIADLGIDFGLNHGF